MTTPAFSSDDAVWLELCGVSPRLLTRLGAQPFDVIRLHKNRSITANYGDETACLLKIVPVSQLDDSIVRIHPVLLDCWTALTESTPSLASTGCAAEPCDSEQSIQLVQLRPLTIPSMASLDCSQTYQDFRCAVEKVDVNDLPDGSIIHINLIYVDPELIPLDLEERLAQALQDRRIMKNTIQVLSSCGHCAVIVVTDLSGPEALINRNAFRVGASRSFQLKLKSIKSHLKEDTFDYYRLTWGDTPSCPGYEHVVLQLLDLLLLQGPAAPAGVLLMGCQGVGKTQIASCVTYKLAADGWMIHSVSLNDLVLRASWATEDELIAMLLPENANLKRETLIVVDNLDLLSSDSDSTDMGGERRLVQNSLLQVMDRVVGADSKVLGLTQEGLRLPPELLKVSRFEKVVTVETPTQAQRECILLHNLRTIGVENKQSETWSELVASMTPGCVAADLNRLCLDAWTRSISRTNDETTSPQWNDIRDAARSCVPSQLASLDVMKPSFVSENAVPQSWLQIHKKSWESFAGYENLVKRIYRTVVVPWKKCLAHRESEPVFRMQESPPSGLLFHGPSGSGKTLACSCLASSLGLPMVKVRAADVLDKYLGGSEAVIRSLFSRARAASPSILLFDEIDSIASNRSSEGEATGVMSRILSTLLNEMDGISGGLRERVLVVACTNRLETIDAALLRPGRLEEHVGFSWPNAQDAEAILNLYLSKVTIHGNVNLRNFAQELVDKGASAALIEGVAREAVLHALRRVNSTSKIMTIQRTDFDDAMRLLKLT